MLHSGKGTPDGPDACTTMVRPVPRRGPIVVRDWLSARSWNTIRVGPFWCRALTGRSGPHIWMWVCIEAINAGVPA